MWRVMVLLILGMIALPTWGQQAPLKLGVLAFRPKAQTQTQWQPLATYLATALGRPVELTAYTYPEFNAAVAQNAVDVALTNPGHFILLKYREGLSAPLATLVTEAAGRELTAFGGVIFTRSDNASITSLADLAGKRIATADRESLGSYQMEAFELVEAGVPLPDKTHLVTTGIPHDHVVEAVLAGRADAGFVRTGVLEGLAREGKLDLGRLKVIHRQNPPGFPYITSTRLYPEWSVAVLPHVDESTARRLTVALLSLPHESRAARAAGIHGFTIPADYSGVETVLRRLRVPPFDVAPEFTLTDLWNKYAPWITALGVLMLLLAGTGAALVVQNRRTQHARRRFATLFEASPEPMWIIAGGLFVDCNPAAIQLLGYADKVSLIGRSPADLSPVRQPDGEDSSVKATQLLNAAAKGVPQRYEWTHLKADGSPFVADVTLAPSTLDGQAVILCVWHDITERKLAQDSLAESEQKLRGLYELSPLGIALNDMKGSFVEFNEAFLNICGYTEEELKALDYWTLTPKKYEADEQRQLESLERTGRYGPYEKEYIRKDGKPVPLRLNGILITAHDGQKYIWSIIEDITRQKQDEARMQQLNQILAQQVQEEVAKNLEKERLLVQQSRLAAMGEMISNIAHQWRQPINALGLLLANIRDAYEYGELDKAFLDNSVNNGTRLIHNMSTTIDDFRNFFRPTSELKRFRMCEGVNDAVRLVKDSFKHNNIGIVVDPCALPCFVVGHPNEYAQVVLNALSNAKDAIVSKNAPGEIHIKTEIQGSTSVVSIRDNGGGIPDDVIGRIFDPYFTTKESGTGIGLYMSKMIMEKMGGDITVRNVEGGAETLISMPVSA